MADPIAFDAASYVGDLRTAGYIVYAHPPMRDGRPRLAIIHEDGLGEDLDAIELKYRAAKKADPEAKRRVLEYLAAERGVEVAHG